MFSALSPISRALLPQSCHHCLMGQMLTLPRRSIHPRAGATEQSGPARRPGAAAQGIMLALALSAFAWIGLALLVPRVW
jgi:hypothetical protein